MCDVTSYFAGCPKNEGHPWPHLRLVSYASADDLRGGTPAAPLLGHFFGSPSTKAPNAANGLALLLARVGGQPPSPRSRTIQVCPKDLRTLLR
jgi:hypothetical protein